LLVLWVILKLVRSSESCKRIEANFESIGTRLVEIDLSCYVWCLANLNSFFPDFSDLIIVELFDLESLSGSCSLTILFSNYVLFSIFSYSSRVESSFLQSWFSAFSETQSSFCSIANLKSFYLKLEFKFVRSVYSIGSFIS